MNAQENYIPWDRTKYCETGPVQLTTGDDIEPWQETEYIEGNFKVLLIN